MIPERENYTRNDNNKIQSKRIAVYYIIQKTAEIKKRKKT